MVETTDVEALSWWLEVAVALHGEASYGGGERGRGGREQWSAAVPWRKEKSGSRLPHL